MRPERVSFFCFIIQVMETNYFVGNRLNCKKENVIFVKYLSDLKNLFESVKRTEESGDIEESKNMLTGEFGKFIPVIYNVTKEARQAFFGKYADKTIEIILRYNEIYERLSEEDINFLTGYNVQVTKNRIKLFLMQQVRSIENILI